jgi:hypothetical protein
MFVLVAKEVSMDSQEQLEEEGSMLKEFQDIFLEDLPKHLSPMR